MKRLLDTDAYVALKRGHAGVEEIVRSSAEIVFSVIVLGELYSGFHDGSHLRKNVAELEDFLDHPFVHVAYLTRTAADRFGRISTALKRKEIPMDDIWIASQAMELGAEVVTFDEHSRNVPGLVVVIPEGVTEAEAANRIGEKCQRLACFPQSGRARGRRAALHSRAAAGRAQVANPTDPPERRHYVRPW